MKILWVTNIPSPYRVGFFNELGKLCELTVLCENVSSTERNKSWSNFECSNFNIVYLKGIRYGVASLIPTSPNKQFKNILKSQLFDAIIVTNYSSISGILFIKYLKRHHIPYMLEGDGAFIKKDSFFKNKIKKSIISSACLCFSTSKSHDDYYLHYGAQKEDIFRYPFTSISKSDLLFAPLTPNEKNILRIQYKLPQDKKIVLSIGQFIHRKGFDILLECAKRLPNYLFLFVGEGPLKETFIKNIEENHIENIVIFDFIEKPRIYDIIKICDLFVLPTREDIWGLVINEALANGLPTITTTKCIAGLELINSENGAIVDVNDIENLIYKISSLLENSNYNQLCENAIKSVSQYTFEGMAKVHFEILSNYLNKKKILFLGYCIPMEEATVGTSFAGNKMQNSIIYYLNNSQVKIIPLSMFPTAPFPKSSKLFIKKRKIYFNNCTSTLISFINLPFLKLFSQINSMKRAAKKIVKKYHIDAILTFNSFPQVGIPANYLKKKYHLPVIPYIADCPIPQKKHFFIKKILRSFFDKSAIKTMRKADYLIVINPFIIENYTLHQKYVLLEGGIDLNRLPPFVEKKKNSKNLFIFSGALTEYNGILPLIDAISNIPMITLNIYGSGDLINRVKEKCQQYPNIVYKGVVSNQEMQQIQMSADFLISPRIIDDLISKVTFPSKIFEYLLSGVPVIATKLSCLTPEYDSFINYLSSNDPFIIQKELLDIIHSNYDSLLEKAKEGRKYILTTKSWEKQIDKITSFLYKIDKNN